MIQKLERYNSRININSFMCLYLPVIGRFLPQGVGKSTEKIKRLLLCSSFVKAL